MSMPDCSVPHVCAPSCLEVRRMRHPLVLDCGHSLSYECALRSLNSISTAGDIQGPQCVICTKSVKRSVRHHALKDMVDQWLKRGQADLPLALDRCGICLETLQGRITILSCGHSFDYECIAPWLARTKTDSYLGTCPTCIGKVTWQARNYALEAVANNVALQIIGEVASAAVAPDGPFGRDAWQHYFGVNVGEEPPIPQEALDLMRTGKYELILMPATADDLRLDVDRLEAIVKAAPGRTTKYRYFSDVVKPQVSGKTVGAHSWWAVVKKGLIEGSCGKSFAEQKILVENLGAGFRVPTVLEASICAFVNHMRQGPQTFWTNLYTRCEENGNDNDFGLWRAVVGGLSGSGLYVFICYCDFGLIGVVGLRKF